MEAGSELQHRTKVNSGAGRSVWVSEPRDATPYIQSRQNGSGSGRGRMLCGFTLGGLFGSANGGSGIGDDAARPEEKSDHLIVAMKPGNAGGAKGVTG